MNLEISAIILAVAITLNYSISKGLRRRNANKPSAALLSKLVTTRNVIAVVTGVTLFTVWVRELANAILSVAAIAGAVLIVSKELITCWLGSLVRTIARPFQIGDVVEIGHWRGKVVDSDLLATTLLEMGVAHQYTGNMVEVPNSVFLNTPIKNLSVTGKFFLNYLVIPFPASGNVEEARQILLKATQPIIEEYQEDATSHLKLIESLHVVDLPSTELRVLIEPVDAKTVNLILRFACPAQHRVSVEQRILQAMYGSTMFTQSVQTRAESLGYPD